MKNNRNIRADKMYFNNGKWETVYTEDNIKRLAYYNIDVPHVVGIGTKTPFSKLSFGDSSDAGHHISGELTAGKVSAIALHEKQTNIDDVKREGQEFTGLSYVTNLRSIRKLQDNTEAKGLAFYSNKTSDTQDTALKTDKGVMYITDDNYIHIGGKPKGYNLIDTRGINRKIPAATQETGPSILLDVSGSIHVNGFINFLKKGNENVSYLTDNPANQMTYRDGEIQYIDPDALFPSEQDTSLTLGAVPEGAIWVGFEKPLSEDTSTTSLSENPRLYIMRAGKATRVLIEGDAAAGAGGGTTGGLTWDGSTDSETNNQDPYYVFRNTSQIPGNILMNTYLGYPSNSGNIPAFSDPDGDNPLPQFLNDTRKNDANDPPAVMNVLGGLAVFDSTKGGTNADYLDFTSTVNKFDGHKQILDSDIYTKTETGKKKQGELGSIYMDRHLMIGGCAPYNGGAGSNPQPFKTMSSAIDVSGGIVNKPLLRSITGSNRGTDTDSSLVTANVNAQDSIIVGDTPPGNFSGEVKESIVVGTHDQTELGASGSIIDNVNTIIMGEQCQSKYINNSLVVGYQCKAGPNSQPTSGTGILDNKKGVVALGHKAIANGPTNTDVRFAFGTSNGSGQDGNVFTIDKEGSVVIQPPGNATTGGNLTVEGDLTVKGTHTKLEVTEVTAEDKKIDINAVINSSGSTVGVDNITSSTDVGGIRLFTTTGGQRIGFTYYKDTTSGASRWTTGFDTSNLRGTNSVNVGIAAGGAAGEEDFVIDKDGNFYLARDTVNNAPDNYYVHIKGTSHADKGNMIFYQNQGRPTLTFKRTDGDIDLSGNIRIDPDAKFGSGSGPTAGTSSKKALTIGGGYTSAANSQPEGFELQHEYNGASKAVVNMKVSGETILGGYGTAGYLKVRNYNQGSSQNTPIVEIDEEKVKAPGVASSTSIYQLLHVSGGYASDKGLSMNRQNKRYGTTNDYRVNLEMGGSLIVDGCHEDYSNSTTSTEKIAQFFEDYNPTSNKYGIVIDISKNNAGDTKANMRIGGDCDIDGKLSVTGLIDPTGLVLNNQSSFPNGGVGDNSGKVTIWSDGGTLKFTAGSSDTEEFATKASVDAITGGGSGSSVNVDSANKILVKHKSDSGPYNLVFTDENNNNKNASLFFDSQGTTAGLRYNPSSNTLSADKFDGKATKIELLNTAGAAIEGFVKVNNTGILSAGGTAVATGSVGSGITGEDGLMSISDKNKLDDYPTVNTTGGNAKKFLNETGSFIQLDYDDLVSTDSTGDASKFLNERGSFAQVNYTDISGTTNVLTNDDDLEFDSGSDRTIQIAHKDTDEGAGDNLTILGADANHSSVNHNGGAIIIKGGNGVNAGNGGNIQLTSGNSGGTGGSVGDIELNCQTGQVKIGNGGLTTINNSQNLILDTGTSGRIQANKPIESIDGTDLSLEAIDTTPSGTAKGVTIKAANGGSTSANGGNITLTAGTAGTTGTPEAGKVKIASELELSSNKKITTDTGDLEIAPNGSSKVKIGGSAPTITTNTTTNLVLSTNGASSNSNASSAIITVENGGTGDIILNPAGGASTGGSVIIGSNNDANRKIKCANAVENSSGMGSQPSHTLTIEGSNSHFSQINGGNIKIISGDKGTADGSSTYSLSGTGERGHITLDASGVFLKSHYLELEAQKGENFDIMIKHKARTSAGAGKKLTISGQDANGTSGSGPSAHGFDSGNIEITAGNGSDASGGGTHNTNGGDGGNIILTPGDGGAKNASGNDGNNGYVEINSTENSSSTTSGALQVKGGVGIASNLHVGGTITSSGNLSVTGTITGDTSLTLDSTTITTAQIGVLAGVTPGTVTASKALVVDSNKDIGTINNLTVSGTITASNNTVDATVGGANLSVGLNVIDSDDDDKIVNLPNPSSTSAGAIIQMVSSSSNKYEVRVLGNNSKINGTTCRDGSGTATNEVEIPINSFVICICDGTDEWNLFANGIRVTPDSV